MLVHALHPKPSPNAYECKRFMFGDCWRFGIECEVQDCEFDPWGSREPFGSLWLWIGGQLIGNPDTEEQLIHALGPLESAIQRKGQRNASKVPGTSYLDKPDFIAWVRFGEDDDFDRERWGAGETIEQLRHFEVAPFEIFPRGFSPFHDGWEAMLFEDADGETIVWRNWRGSEANTHELSLPVREVTRVIALAADWYTHFRQMRLGSAVSPGC